MKYFFIIMFLAVSSVASANEIFFDNFDSQSDWQPHPATGDVSPAGALASCDYGTDCTGQVPIGWSYYRSDGFWWGPAYQDTIRVNSDNHRGASGKAYTQWNESNSGASGDGWGADGILTKYFPQEKEVFFQFWMRMESNFQWRTVSDPNADQDMLKIVWIGHFDGTGSVFSYFTDGNTSPIYQFLVKRSQWGWRHAHDVRCDPQETNYYCGMDGDKLFADANTEPGDSGQAADGNWHAFTFRVVINTFSGGSWNSDGIIEFWYDKDATAETPDYQKTDIQWVASGADTSIGWNMLGIGGNAYNSYAAESTHSEQWYSIDDVCIATQAADLNTCGGGSAQHKTIQLGSGTKTIQFGSGGSKTLNIY